MTVEIWKRGKYKYSWNIICIFVTEFCIPTSTSFTFYGEGEIRNFFSHEIISTVGAASQLILEVGAGAKLDN